MAQILPGIESSHVISRLDTYNHTAELASMYKVSVVMNEIPPSGLSIIIEQNGSPVASSAVPASGQQIVQLQTVLNCAVSDLISVVISSSLAAETGPNIVKGIINIHPGYN